MSHLYKMSEWIDSAGNCHCNDTSDLSGISGYWWVTARLLDMTPANFVKWLVETYQPDYVSLSKYNQLYYWWNKEHYNKAHSYLLYINRISRQKNFIVQDKINEYFIMYFPIYYRNNFMVLGFINIY